MNIFKLFNKKLQDEPTIDDFHCEHEECPYKICIYHRYSINSNFIKDEKILIYMPKNNKEAKNCMNYMDI